MIDLALFVAESSGAHGTSMLLLTVFVLAVFVGIGVDSRHAAAAEEDIRVEFVESGGRVRTVEPDATAAGANCMLFRTPDDLDPMHIRSFRLLINSSADWVKRGS